MKRCAVCGKNYAGSEKFCRDDGTPLASIAVANAAAEIAGGLATAAAVPTPVTGRLSPDETATVVGPMPADPNETPPLHGKVSLAKALQHLPEAEPPTTAVVPLTPAGALQAKTRPPPLPARPALPPKSSLTKAAAAAAPALFVPPKSAPSGSARAAAQAQAKLEEERDQHQQQEEADEVQSSYIGKIIDDRYLIGPLIGQGGMGAVFQCEQIHLKKRMAVKLLHENLVQKKQLIARFTREARAISRLSSPHTVMVYDFGRWGELFYLVMELMEGEPLDTLLDREGPQPAERVAKIALQMCDSLAEAHTNGIIHRDLKPENVMLIRNQAHPDFVKILDFGLAKVQGVNDEYTVHSQRDIFGTPYYMSPEQIRASEIDGRADIYAVGTLMFKMLTGQHVFRQKNTFDILKAHLMEPPPRMADVAPMHPVPQAMERIVIKCLQKDPGLRFQGMDELAMALATSLRSGFKESGVAELPATAADAAVGTPVAAKLETKPARAKKYSTQLSAITRLSDVMDPEEFMRSTRAAMAWRQRAFFAALALAALALGTGWWWSSHGRSPTEAEPNDALSRANRLGPGDTSQGVIGRRSSDRTGDRDCFLLPETADTEGVTVSVAGVPNMDLQLAFFGESDKPLLTLNHRARGGGELARWLDPKLAPTMVCVSEAAVPGQVPGESLSDRYTLTVTHQQRPLHTEAEPNDEAPGNEIDSAVAWTANLDGPLDRDVFRVPGTTEGRLLRAQLQVESGQDSAGLRLELFDGSRRLIGARTAGPDALSVELAFVGATRQLPDHIAVLRLPGKSGDAKAEELHYTLTVTLQDVADQAEAEPNNSEATAQPVVMGAWHHGDTSDAGQVDWLRIDGGDPAMKNTRLEVAAPRNTSFLLLVRDLAKNVDLRLVPVNDAAVKEIVISNGSGEGLLLRIAPLDQPGKKREIGPWRLRARAFADGQSL